MHAKRHFLGLPFELLKVGPSVPRSLPSMMNRGINTLRVVRRFFVADRGRSLAGWHLAHERGDFVIGLRHRQPNYNDRCVSNAFEKCDSNWTFYHIWNKRCLDLPLLLLPLLRLQARSIYKMNLISFSISKYMYLCNKKKMQTRSSAQPTSIPISCVQLVSYNASR